MWYNMRRTMEGGISMYIYEPEKKLPVIAEADLCVVGGSCTGVFAAVRAARLGMKVVLLEKHNILGGTAVTGLVNIWHSLHDTDAKNQIIAGLTHETVQRLKKRNAVTLSDNPNSAYSFNPWELALILDEYVRENRIQLLLHTSYCAVVWEGRQVQAVILENSDGRAAVRAKFFIDASGDGRVARDLEIPSYVNEKIQPPTACFYLQGNTAGLDLGKLIREHGREFGLDDDWGWYNHLSGSRDISMRADNHVFGLRLDRAEDLTAAEMEGRRLADGFASLLRTYSGREENYPIVGMCSHIGTRETVHFRTKFRADVDSLLLGKRYADPVLQGTYRVDIHHSEDMGITFRYLDGREETFYGKNTRTVRGNWREKAGLSGEAAKFYQLPFDILVTGQYDNFIPVGRMIDADEGAFGALRVMVNLNQLGEAAGVAAYRCVQDNTAVQFLDGSTVTRLLRDGGSAL